VAQVIAFRGKPPENIDILTAVDLAIRDLREIATQCRADSARKQADECRRMLQKALKVALQEG
jgi:hypothetical protein